MRKVWAIVLGLVLMGSSLVWAEEKEEEKKTTEIEEIVVTATKTESRLSDVPFTVHVVKEKEIEAQPKYYISNFGELIRDLPDVHVGQYYPWGPPWVILRGLAISSSGLSIWLMVFPFQHSFPPVSIRMISRE